MLDTPKARNSILNDRHRALGSDLSSSWNDMPVPQNYSTDPHEETAAVRYRAGLFDVSALKMINVSGPDAAAFLNHLLTSDVTKAAPGDSHISNIVNADGGIIDDVLVYVDGPNQYRVSHGSGTFEEAAAAAQGRFAVSLKRDDDVHILSLQGPLALKVLAAHTPMNLANLGYFQHQKTTLFGRPVAIARGGYSAERGYEVYCASADAQYIWDSILNAGKASGVVPASWSCLDIIRVEGGLLFFPFDMPNPDTTPWEVRADWSVDLTKPDFVGKQALVAKKGKERSFITGIELLHSEAAQPGSKITANGKEVGVVTSSTYSQHLMKSLAMAQIDPAFTKLGTELVVYDNGAHNAIVVRMPFYDPMRLRTHPAPKRT
jgi:aminomethyltransferase